MHYIGKTLGLALAATAFVPFTNASEVTLSAFTSGGNTSSSAGGCFRITSALGQSMQNAAAGGKYAIQTGLLAVVKTDAIFHGTFEVCL
jgi:hypothetical protein